MRSSSSDGSDGVASSRAALPPASSARRSSAPGRLDWVEAPADGDLTSIVRAELARARTDNRTLIVYVGAAWCEPCGRFHAAAARGALDTSFPTLRILGFDRDRDEARLSAAGYSSRLIPLFALPNPDGRASGRSIDGSIKGPGAVDDLTPRLRELLGD